MFNRFSTEPPLHKALLEDRSEDIKRLSQQPGVLQERNKIGFTAIELAQLLGKWQNLAIMQPANQPKHIKIYPKDYQRPLICSTKQFFGMFGVHYCSYLHFINYESLQFVLQNCPLILKTSLGKESQRLGHWYQAEQLAGFVADVSIRWTDESMGFGLFAENDLAKDSYIGEYTGLVRQLKRGHPDKNEYCAHYPTRFWSWHYYAIDALEHGNELRFINHSNQPNLRSAWILDSNLLHLAFFANNFIPKGTELTINYGQDYWRRRRILLNNK